MWRTIWSLLKKLKIELPYYPAIPLLCICLEKTIIQKDTYIIQKDIPIFIAALFTTAKTWRQPKYPLTDEWLKMWYTYTMEYYSATKKNELMPFAATQIDLEILILSEVSQWRKISYDIIYMWKVKINTNELTDKTEIHPQTQKTNLPKGKDGLERQSRSMGLTNAWFYTYKR